MARSDPQNCYWPSAERFAHSSRAPRTVAVYGTCGRAAVCSVKERDRVQLILPNPDYEASYRQYIHELGDEKRYPFPLDFDHTDFQELLAKLERFRNGTDIPDGFVASSTYWLVDDNELVGVSNLRHYLNDRIRRAGGHIGLGIRPSRRGSGLGKYLLRATIEQAMERGIQ
jgi:predicted acetyltransferase